MRITYDKEADAIYIYLNRELAGKRGAVTKTEGSWPVHFDFTKDGKLFGIEIMDASRILDIKVLKTVKFERIDKKPMDYLPQIKNMRITYDKEADAIYIYLNRELAGKRGAVEKTRGFWPTHFQISKDGKLFGIEIMDASRILDIKVLKTVKFERIDKKEKKK